MTSISDFAFAAAYGLPFEGHAVRQLEAGEERGNLADSNKVRMVNILEPNDNAILTCNCEEHPP